MQKFVNLVVSAACLLVATKMWFRPLDAIDRTMLTMCCVVCVLEFLQRYAKEKQQS